MQYNNVVIEGLAYIEAPHVITSAWLEEQIQPTLQRLGLPGGQLERLTGIRARRFWDPGVMPSEVATMAAKKVIDQTGIDPNDLELLINTSVSKDYLEPSVASLVHGNLGLPSHCMNFDLGNACLGFVNGMDQAALMIETGAIKKALIVNGESSREVYNNTLSRIKDPNCDGEEFRNNFATLTLGSGAVAMVISHVDHAKSGFHRINCSVSRAATQHSRLCLGTNEKMTTDASALLLAGIELAAETWRHAASTIDDWSDDNLSLYVPHQVSVRHTQAFCESLGVDFGKFYLNVMEYGNMGPVGLPMTLAMADEAGRCQKDNQIGLVGIGSGLNCTMMSVTW